MRNIVKIAVAFSAALVLAMTVQASDHKQHDNVYSTSRTTIGALLSDPAARAVLEEHVPDLIANESIQRASDMTLQTIQGYAPNMLSEEKLSAIDADLAELGKN